MSFLAPLFLLGALAVAAPIIFHLIRRTTRDRIPFSSLMFLQTTPPRVTRRSRLENVLLLILRCLVLCLLALGFARPLLQRPVRAGLADAPGRLILLVDSSASMRRGGLWADAQAKVEEVLRKTPPTDQVALFTFDREVHRLVTFEQWAAWSAGDRASLTAKRFAATTPSWADTLLGNALVTAAEAFEEAAKREAPGGRRRIVLISDFQEGSRLDRLQGYEWPRGIELATEPLKPKRPTNAGLQLVTDRDTTEKSPTDAPVRVRVCNSGDARREQFQFGWARAGERGFLGAPVDIYVPPGQSRVASAPKPAGSVERLVLAGDDEDFDNVVNVLPPKPEQIRIFFLGQDADNDPAQALFYLQRAFQETRRQLVQVVALGTNTGFKPAELSGAPLTVTTDPMTEDRVRMAQEFLKAGKTVVLVMKSPAAGPVLAALAGGGPVSVEEAAADRYALLAQIDFTHPLFAPFDDPRFSDFTKIHFWRHRRLATNNLPGARVLARLDNGDPALVQVPVGSGMLLVFTTSWVPADSQLALSSKFVPLLYSILELSGGSRERLAQYFVGDLIPLPQGGAAAGQKTTLRKPDGTTVELPPGESRFAQTDLPGVYAVTSVQPPVRFAVNLAPDESRTAPLPLEELERMGIPLKIQSDQAAKREAVRVAFFQASELENRQKLWRWLLVTALAILIVETWMAGRSERQTLATKGQAG